MYNFLTAFVTTGVLVFITVYNTSFITVVTLGGTVLGSAAVGFFTALATVVLRLALHSRGLRYATGMVCCGLIVVNTVRCLPGWNMEPAAGAGIFLLLLCAAVTLINEYTLEEKRSG